MRKRPLLQQLADRVQQRRFLPCPGMREIHFLSALDGLRYVARIRVGEFDFAREIVRAAEIEIDQVLVAEIILNALCLRRDDWFAEREILEDARRRVDLG